MPLPSQPLTLPLWPGPPPLANPEDDRPPLLLRIFAQPEPVGRPMILIFPGGGYNTCFEPEGLDAAIFYFEAGFHVALAQYRTQFFPAPRPLGRAPLLDAARALTLLNESTLPFDRDRVAVAGFSAGGHLAASLAIHGPDLPAPSPLQPSAYILAYPVITSGRFRHGGSFHNLCGDDPDNPDREFFSLEKQVRPGLPAMFLWHTADDAVVPAANTLLFAQALAEAGVPYAVHVFSEGPHGLRMGAPKYPGTTEWPLLSLSWLKKMGGGGPPSAGG